MAAMSRATLQRGVSSSTTTRCLVCLTDSRIASSSSGERLSRSMTSASIPSSARRSAASRQTVVIRAMPASVKSRPARSLLAFPIGSVKGSSGTSALVAARPRWLKYTTGAELLDQSLGRAHRATPGVDDPLVRASSSPGDVLAQQDDRGVTLHLLADGLVLRAAE